MKAKENVMDEFKIKISNEELSREAKILAELAPKASMEAVRTAWARGLSVTVLEDGKIVSIAPDGTRTFVKELDPL